jgi:hypothetical protein
VQAIVLRMARCGAAMFVHNNYSCLTSRPRERAFS